MFLADFRLKQLTIGKNERKQVDEHLRKNVRKFPRKNIWLLPVVNFQIKKVVNRKEKVKLKDFPKKTVDYWEFLGKTVDVGKQWSSLDRTQNIA